ncbi:alpha/beta hydrolase [Pseudoalteromonas luteoviolacea]|uniref:alpha/beta hydrolase n=1 Tax=Pseudoalteromonas luteoviolacea TaxID=43657 RepID=UPI00069164FA|nr:alpha/beta fold hydrolase [Pseudoalteromonas luteoviolacea]
MLKRFIGLISTLWVVSAVAQDCTTLPTDHQQYLEGMQTGEYRFANDVGPAALSLTENMAYADYISATRALILKRNKRATLLCPLPSVMPTQAQQAQVIDHIAPYQLLHNNQDKGILLIHGLTDSPYIFNTIAQDLYRQGFNVRTLLLPGHGTAADDLRHVTNDDWQRHVRYAIKRTSQDFKHFAIMGFSTGAALATLEIEKHRPSNLQALALVAPATESHNKNSWMAQWVDWLPLMNWLDEDADLDFAKYESFPLAAAALVHNVMVDMMQSDVPADLPILTILSDVDATIDSQATLQLLTRWAKTHRAPLALRLYANNPIELDQRIALTHIDKLDKVIDMSHVGLLIPQHHPYYGEQGAYRHCGSYFADAAAYQTCKSAKQIIFGEHHSTNKAAYTPLARVTFNPDYAGLTKQLSEFLNRHVH